MKSLGTALTINVSIHFLYAYLTDGQVLPLLTTLILVCVITIPAAIYDFKANNK
jgi:hypothetical protein